jgi:hypothetical protein
MRLRHFFAAVAACGLLLALSSQAQASLSLVTSRGALGGTDFVDWGTLGPAFTDVLNGSTVTSNLGRTLSITDDLGGNMQRRDQGTGWNGNFAPGDHLLWMNQPGQGPLTLTISGLPLLSAIGSQIQADFFGAFTAKIEAFDSAHNSLGSFTEDGVSNANGDNSAIFLGVRSTSADIASIVYSLTAAVNDTRDFAINQLDFTSQAVPEPSTLVSLGLMGLCTAGFALRRRILTAR